MVDELISFAILGVGNIGFRHASTILENNEAKLAAIIDTVPEKEELADKLSIPFFNSLEDFLVSDFKTDVINICTPNGLHAPQAVLCMKCGFDVVIEKPMGLTKAECEEVIYTALHYSRKVFCVMQNRYSPPSKWLKSLVENNILGKIFSVHINCFWNRDERYYNINSWHGTKKLDGGTLFTQFSHFIDIMYWLFGDIKNIHAKFNNFNHEDLIEFEDSGIVQFDFVNEGIGSINYSTSVWDKNFESSITIIAENGTVKVGGQYMDKVDYCHIKNYEMPILEETSPPNYYGQWQGSASNHHFLIQNVIDTLKGKSKVTTNGLEGLKEVDIIERIYQLKNI
jgi:predicted dehydrogenase